MAARAASGRTVFGRTAGPERLDLRDPSMRKTTPWNWKSLWPWLAIAAAAYFLAKQIVQ